MSEKTGEKESPEPIIRGECVSCGLYWPLVDDGQGGKVIAKHLNTYSDTGEEICPGSGYKKNTWSIDEEDWDNDFDDWESTIDEIHDRANKINCRIDQASRIRLRPEEKS